MQKLRKAFIVSVMSITVLSMSMMAVPFSVGAVVSAGDLVKVQGNSAVYYIDADNVKHVFPNEVTYKTWYRDFSMVKTITTDELTGFTRGDNVTARPGTKLIKSPDENTVYAVEPGGVLRSIVSEANAIALWGSDWAKRIITIVPSFMVNYTVGSPLTAGAYPVGTLLKNADSADVYYYDGTNYRKFEDESALLDNRLSLSDVVTTSMAITAGGTQITGAEADLIDTSEGGGAEVPGGSGLSVALASDTPASTSILADPNGTSAATQDAQALIPVLKLNFTAAADGAVEVDTLELNRTGISSDSDIDNVYLYDGSNILARLAEMQSISDKVITFSDSDGLFTVPAGSTKSILVRFDLNRESTSGKTIGMSLVASGDVVAGGASVSGSFPITSNLMATADVTDFGEIKVERIAGGNSTAVDPGAAGFTAAHFRLTPSSQDMELQYLRLRMIGSASVSDIKSIKLYDGSTLLGTGELDSNGYVSYDLTASPLAIDSSVTKNLYVKVDVVGGSTRTFYFSIEKGSDVVVFEKEYNIFLRPNSGTVGTFSSQSSSQVTIGSGSLTVSRSSDSPSGNIADGATNVVLAKYAMKAVGEAIKVSQIGYYVTITGTGTTLKNSKILVDGSQVGTTNATLTTAVANVVSTTVNFTVQAGQTKYLTIVADTTGTTAASDTVKIVLNGGGTNGQRMSSLGTIAVPSTVTDGNTLTVKAGTVVSAKNTGMGDYTAASPTGVVGTANVKIGSYTITAGAGEDVDISMLTVSDNGTNALGTNFQNLKLKNQSTGVEIGSTITTLQGSVNYSYEFSPSTAIRLANGQTMIVDVYADILTNAGTTGNAIVGTKLINVSATGVSTSASADDATDRTGQNVYIAASGTLLIEDVASSNQVQSNIVYASTASETNEVELYKFKLTGLTESSDITRIIITDTIVSSAYNASTANGKPTSTLLNFKLYDGSTLVAGPVALFGTSTPSNGGYIDFNFGTGNEYNVGANVEKIFTLKAAANSWDQISSGATHTFALTLNPLNDGSVTKPVTARGHDSSVDQSGPAASLTGGNAITVRKSYPIVTREALASNTLPSGSTDGLSIAKFKVSSQSDQVRLKKITLNVTINDTTTSTAVALSSFKLYRNGTLMGSTEYSIFDGTGTAVGDELSHSGTATLSTDSLKGVLGAANSTSTRVVIMLGLQRTDLEAGDTSSGEEIIAAGSTNTYELKCNVANAHQGATTDSDSVVVQLVGDDDQTTPYTGNLGSVTPGQTYRNGIVGLGTDYSATNYNFIWSDYSANIGDHTSTIASTGGDWTHGYQVRSTASTPASYIPLDSWTLSK